MSAIREFLQGLLQKPQGKGPFARAKAASSNGDSSIEDLRRQRRDERRKQRIRSQQRQMMLYAFIIVALGGFYFYANRDLTPSLRVTEQVEYTEALEAAADAMVREQRETVVEEAGTLDERRLGLQRQLVADLARRHIGSEPRGGALDDLRILQQLVDDRVLATDQVYELQALGVVLGDVMVEQLGLRWVVVDDEYGRTRALQYGSRDDVFFPVTMISKRYEKGIQVDVEELYAKAEREVAALRRTR